MGPKECFALVCRTVADVTTKNVSQGSNMPFLLLCSVVMRHRHLAFPHSPMDTLTLSNYMTTTFRPAKIEEMAQMVADAFLVPVGALDFTARVTVR